MIITSIEKQKKKGRYNVFLDGKFAFGVYEDTLVKYALHKNDELTEEMQNEIRNYDEYNYGKKVAYDFLYYRQRSEKELRTKLKQKNISGVNLEKIIEFFISHKFLNDEEFARSFVADELLKKPSGKRMIYHKLLRKGISKEIIEQVLVSSYLDESLSAELLLKKYSVKIKDKPLPVKKQKAYNYLISRGFEFETTKEVVNRFFKL
ncbi:MAG: RecX family transcriptional regulator [Ignavibacteria bacterium]|nr:RecX family transcriptional regulator [Ignavibacteria bacterium]